MQHGAYIVNRRPAEKAEFFPPEDIRLEPGNRLVVLATIGGLQNAEHGVVADRTHRVRILSVLSNQARFEGGRVISRITGCNLGAANVLFAELPATIPQALFLHQAQRLARDLTTTGVEAEILPV